MSATGWDKFFWSDWTSDVKLRLCSIGARGLWIELLAICAASKPKGYITIVDGEKPSVAELALVTGVPENVLLPLLLELGRNGVYSVDERGLMFSRRMVRQGNVRLMRQAAGRKGGAATRDNGSGIFQANPPSKRQASSKQASQANGFDERRASAGNNAEFSKHSSKTPSSAAKQNTGKPDANSHKPDSSQPSSDVRALSAHFQSGRLAAWPGAKPLDLVTLLVQAEQILSEGISLELAKSTVTRVMQRYAETHDQPIHSLKFFEGAMRDAMRANGNGHAAEPAMTREEGDFLKLKTFIDRWIASGCSTSDWPSTEHFAPTDPRCQLDPALLSQFRQQFDDAGLQIPALMRLDRKAATND